LWVGQADAVNGFFGPNRLQLTSLMICRLSNRVVLAELDGFAHDLLALLTTGQRLQ